MTQNKFLQAKFSKGKPSSLYRESFHHTAPNSKKNQSYPSASKWTSIILEEPKESGITLFFSQHKEKKIMLTSQKN
ncbi:hypothetical protein EUGRSUZ_K03555 [Eucalyptus grandis]|uniref:Uncharacterized protein n=2 Tax=Eucalyptus grandis TaxID=71139 RepID=A0ACC3J0E6_EUCGR|nr:hypothetical protein EUGRSUZ_K03555 [Eucalyptus grandis]